VLGAAGFYASRHVAESAPVSPPPPAPTLEAPPPLPVLRRLLPSSRRPRWFGRGRRQPAPVGATRCRAPASRPGAGRARSAAAISGTVGKGRDSRAGRPGENRESPLAPTARDKADAELRRAETALASGRSGEALDGLRAALKLDPGYVAVRQALLRQLLDARKFDEAMVVLQDGLENMPTQTGWAVSLARLQLEQGDLAGADRTLARSQGYAEANADYAGFQGHVKSRLGAQRQAIAHYQRATRLAPGEGRWWLGLGLAFEADGRLPEARTPCAGPLPAARSITTWLRWPSSICGSSS
jgi:MSHA biogenesis protein MshN